MTAEPTTEAAIDPTRGARIISGLDLVDYGAGGLYPEKVYLLKGDPGTGKTIAGLQFLARGLQLGEPGILITDQKPKSVLDQARTIGFSLDDAVSRGQLLIMNPSRRYFELVESPADVMAITEELTEHIEEVGARRLVVDPVFCLVTTMYSTHFALTVTQSLLNSLEDLSVTTLLLAGDEENPELNPMIRMIEQNSFGIISLSPDPKTGGRIMRLSKLRFAPSEHLAAHYRILDGRGIINYRGEDERVDDVSAPWQSEDVNRSVLLLGADPATISRVREALGDEYDVSAETDLEKGVRLARETDPGIVLVTPSRATSALRAVADLAKSVQSSVAFLSPARNRSADSVLYLRAGADDFITEPFRPEEFRARVEALVRRSGRRLNSRMEGLPSFDDLSLTADLPKDSGSGHAFVEKQGELIWTDEVADRLRRNIEVISRFGMEFVLYWIRGADSNGSLNKDLAQLCRQEDILCHNRNGDFVALLTGTDENGARGFENRLDEKLGKAVTRKGTRRGYAPYKMGQSVDDFMEQSLSAGL